MEEDGNQLIVVGGFVHVFLCDKERDLNEDCSYVFEGSFNEVCAQ